MSYNTKNSPNRAGNAPNSLKTGASRTAVTPQQDQQTQLQHEQHTQQTHADATDLTTDTTFTSDKQPQPSNKSARTRRATAKTTKANSTNDVQATKGTKATKTAKTKATKAAHTKAATSQLKDASSSLSQDSVDSTLTKATTPIRTNDTPQVTAPAPQAAQNQEHVMAAGKSPSEQSNATDAFAATKHVLDQLIPQNPVNVASFQSGFQTSSYTQLEPLGNQLSFNTSNSVIAAYEIGDWGFDYTGLESQHSTFVDPNTPLTSKALSESTPSIGQRIESAPVKLAQGHTEGTSENATENASESNKAQKNKVQGNKGQGNISPDQANQPAQLSTVSPNSRQEVISQTVAKSALKVEAKTEVETETNTKDKVEAKVRALNAATKESLSALPAAAKLQTPAEPQALLAEQSAASAHHTTSSLDAGDAASKISADASSQRAASVTGQSSVTSSMLVPASDESNLKAPTNAAKMSAPESDEDEFGKAELGETKTTTAETVYDSDAADVADDYYAVADNKDDDDDELSVNQDKDVQQNPYTQEINRLALQSDLNSLSQSTQCSIVQEYFAIFTQALNTIMLNCNEREIVESGLETIITKAAPIFEIEYKNFFYMCIHAAPKALFWMLQYPFFSNFFLVKQRTLTLHMPKNLVITHKIIDEQIALEVSTTMENFAELKKRFTLTSVPNLNLQDNIMLSLYEEQLLQKGLVKPLPQMTQRERIRKLVKLGGAFPADPAKLKLRQVNHQIFSLHNLRVTELRNMSIALEKLAHAPRRLSRIFGKDFKHYCMPMQLIMKKMDSWVELYPADQQCLLVQMDDGFLIRSPQDRSQVYTQDSFKEHPLIILAGLEVCYQTHEEPPEETEFIREYGDDSEYNYKGIAAFKELAAKMEAARERIRQQQRFDDHDLDTEYFNDLYQDEDEDDDDDDEWFDADEYQYDEDEGNEYDDGDDEGDDLAFNRQSQSARSNQAQKPAHWSDQNQAKRNGSSQTKTVQTGGKANVNLDEDDELYRKALAKRSLQASDFEISHLDEFADDEVEDIDELEDNETFDFADEDAVLGENNDKPINLNFTPNDMKNDEDEADELFQDQKNKPCNPSFISGVYFGTQGAAFPSQLRRFNERNLLVDGLKVGFMIVTL